MTQSAAFSIPIFVDEPAGIDRRDEMLLGGVPLAQGMLRPPASQGQMQATASWFNLTDPAGRAYTVEGTAAAYWPDGSIKWLHLCGLVDLAAGRRNEFLLGPCLDAPAEGLEVNEQARPIHMPGAGIEIKGGPLEVQIQADEWNALAVRYMGSHALMAPGISAALELIGPDGLNRRSIPLSFAGGSPQVVSRGANRVVVRLAGHFPDGRGGDAGELIIFLEFFRQSPEIRIEPVFIYLGRPEQDLVSSLTLSVHSTIGGLCREGRYGFSTTQGKGHWDVLQRFEDNGKGDGPRWPMSRLVQLGSTFYRIQKRTAENASWVKAVEGAKAQGWCHLAGPQGNVTAAMRYFWQEYPRSLGIDVDRGTITFGLVPPEAEPLDLRRYSTINYGMLVYETGRGPFPQNSHGARGIAKASELMIRFDTTGPDDAPDRGVAFNQPCRIMTSPKHLADTKALGQIAPIVAGKQPRVEALLNRLAEYILQQRDARGWYGMMDFGDIIEAYRPERDMWAFDEGGYGWINSEALPDFGLWLTAFRNGRTDLLEAAIEMTRHNRDVDMYHRGPMKGSGTRHHVNHWGDYDKEWRVSSPQIKRIHYYFTADPWTAEVIRETTAVYQSYQRRGSMAPSMTAALAGIYSLWEMTGREQYASAVRNLLDVYAQAIGPDGQFRSTIYADLTTGVGEPLDGGLNTDNCFFLNSFGGQHLLVELAELLGHKDLLAGIARHAEFFIAGPAARDGMLVGKTWKYHWASILPFLACAYRSTGKGAFAQAIERALETMDVDFAHLERFGQHATAFISVPVSHEGLNKLSCELASILHLSPYGLAALPG